MCYKLIPIMLKVTPPFIFPLTVKHLHSFFATKFQFFEMLSFSLPWAPKLILERLRNSISLYLLDIVVSLLYLSSMDYVAGSSCHLGSRLPVVAVQLVGVAMGTIWQTTFSMLSICLPTVWYNKLMIIPGNFIRLKSRLETRYKYFKLE